MQRQRSNALVGLTFAVAVAACGKAETACDPNQNAAGYHPAIVATDFSSTIDNKYLPYLPGTVFKWHDADGNVVEQDVTSDTKIVMGVTTLVVHDFMKSKTGQLLEDTFDYYAQDKEGNVWYFGEDTKAYVGTQVSNKGSWVAGESCAWPGIVMTASPRLGDKYSQEYLPGEAEDEAEIVGLAETITVPYGTFQSCVKTRETTRLAPGDVENKYYCPGVGGGPLLSVDIGSIDAGKREELISINGKTAP